MISFDYHHLRNEADRALHGAVVSPKKLIAIHSGVAIGLELLLSVLSHLLGQGIAGTGGLSGIGMRAVLETAQTVLQFVSLVLLPFWSIGYIRAVLQWADWAPADAPVLLHGFRRWGAVLRLQLLQGFLYCALLLVGAQLAGVIFLLTPAAQPLYALTEELAAAGITDPYDLMENEAYMAAAMKMVPYVLAVAALLVAPLAYRLRFAEYILMDIPQAGALGAMLGSWHLTRRNCLSLLKLDLRFWWFYLAQGLIVLLGYGDMLLPMLGVQLGVDADVAMFGFYIAALICEFVLFVWQKNRVFTVYGLAYRQLAVPRQPESQAQPKNVPWNV